MYRHHTSEPGQYRGWLHLNLPENPWCWLFGHTPRPVITEWRFNIAPSLWIDCRVCGRRYSDPDQAHYLQKRVDLEGVSYKEAADELTARRVANARRLPAAEFCAGVDRRAGWSTREVVLHHETHWPGGKRAKSRRRDPRTPRLSHIDAGFKLHLGDRGSETPIDAHVKAGPFACYVTIGGIGGRLCELLGRGQKRNLSLQVHGGDLRWELWHDDQSGNAPDGIHKCDKRRRPKLWPWSAGRDKYRTWMCLRDGSIDLNPADALWGHRLFHFTDVGDPVTAFVVVGEFAGDSHLVSLQLREQRRHRDHGPAWARREDVSYAVEWRADSKEGIPFRNDSWKGDGVLASGVSLPAEFSDPNRSGEWVSYVTDKIAEGIRKDRRRYNYSPPTDAVR